MNRRNVMKAALASAVAAASAGCAADSSSPGESPATPSGQGAAAPPGPLPATASGTPAPMPRATTGKLADRVRFGAWAQSGSGLIQDHVSLEWKLGARLPIFSWFQAFDGWNEDITGQIAALRPQDPYDNMICWEFFGVRFADLNAGVHDHFLADYFVAAKRYPGRVIIRLFHESNGNWYPWSVTAPNSLVKDTSEWITAWRRVVGIARQCEAHNVKFMFCPTSFDTGGLAAEQYWPGAEWVDLIGVDGYNEGWHGDGTPFRTAEDLITPMYHRLTALHPTAEFMVGEIGCAANAGKAAWHEDLYTSPKFPRLTQLCFFSENKKHDWRLDSDRATLKMNQRHLSKQRG